MHRLDSTAENSVLNDVLRAVHDAQPAWEQKSPRDRSRCIRRIRQSIVASQDEIAETISSETKRPRTEVLMQEVTASLALLRHIEKRYPKWLSDTRFRELKPGFWMKLNRRTFNAIGVIAVIGPSTFPFSLLTMQTCAALMCGNTVVLKPSEKCPETASVLDKIFSNSDLPANVVRVVNGDASIVESIIAHASINKVLFTGGSISGRRIAELCGKHFKPSLLELGGYGTAIVCDDADLDLAASGLLWSASYTNGRACIGTRRVLVLPELRTQFIEKLLNRNRQLVECDPTDPRSDVANGFRLLISDSDPAPPTGDHSSEPALATSPVLEIVTVSDMENAINLVNTSVFGLSASIWSRNVSRAESIARRLKVGMVWINDASVALPDVPWGGVRDSGWGSLFARESIPELTRMKTISSERRRFGSRKLWWYPYSQRKYELTRTANAFLFGSRSLKSSLALVASTWKFIFRRRHENRNPGSSTQEGQELR